MNCFWLFAVAMGMSAQAEENPFPKFSSAWWSWEEELSFGSDSTLTSTIGVPSVTSQSHVGLVDPTTAYLGLLGHKKAREYVDKFNQAQGEVLLENVVQTAPSRLDYTIFAD
ncbi:hypothetical protein FOL47_000216 [Perkinsus chesapeaki]|uniref:Uncharacterized protein n=1 Tax=Perkinsus chesapeaki TaxID=330153 RepID=A0A7J6KZ65_PERCH|nr:hypothetical protein FOL47_000216 [Perkinsus chesapeaki]